MINKRFQFGILFFALFIDMFGFGIVMPILPRYAEFLGATSWQLGLVVSVFSIAQLFMLPFWGNLSDKIGRKPVLMISMLGTAVGYMIISLSHSMKVMLLGRVLDGAAGGNMSVIQASVVDMTKPEERSRMMGILGAAYGIGFIFGPAFGGWASHRYGFAAPMVMAAALAAFNLILIALFLPESKKNQKENKNTLLQKSHAVALSQEGDSGAFGGVVAKSEIQALAQEIHAADNEESPPLKQSSSFFMLWQHIERKNYVIAVLTFFFFVLGFSMIVTLLALFFYHRYRFNEMQTGYVYVLFGVVAIVVEGVLFGRLAKKWGDRKLASIGALLLGLAAFFIPLTGSTLAALVSCLIFALGDSLITPGLPSIVSRSSEEAWQGTALGFYHSAGCLARCVGPVLAGSFLAINSQSDHYALASFWMASGFLLASFTFSLSLPR